MDPHEDVRLSFAGPGEIRRREVVRDPQESPGESKSREVELGSESWTCLLLQLFLNSCAADIILVTLLRTAVETAIVEYTSSLRNGEVPTTLTQLFWRWSTASSVLPGRSARSSHSRSFPLPSLRSLMVSVDVKHHGYLLTYLSSSNHRHGWLHHHSQV